MVKLASAREMRMYGPRLGRNRAEYINAGMYVFATILIMAGFGAEFSSEPTSGLVILLLGFVLVAVANAHDLVAHLAGIDFRVRLMGFDAQLALVEFAVPLVQALGSLLSFLGFLFLFIQEEKGFKYPKLEKHALNLLIAGPALWLLGSIHNSCQIYERADGHVQILQQSVQIPFLVGSVVFLVASILNSREQAGSGYHGVDLLGKTMVWMDIFGGLLLFVGGIANVLKVFKMQQVDGLRLEKLRGGAQERLVQEREGQVPLIIEEQRRRRRVDVESRAESPPPAASALTPYKDVLLSQS